MNTLHGSRPAAAFIFLGLLTGIGLLTMTMAQPGAGQVAPDAEDEPEIERTDTPGVTKQANTLFFVGKIASIEDDEMTVLLPDNKEETFAIHDKTRILMNGKAALLSELRPTDAVKILSDIGHRDRADMIVVARVDETAASEETLESAGAREGGRMQDSQNQQYPENQMWQGKLFVAPLLPNSAAAQAGLRAGDIILLVEADAALDADAALQGLQIRPTQNTPAIIVDPTAIGRTGQVVPGTVAPGAVVPGAVVPGTVVPGRVGRQTVIIDGVEQPPTPQPDATPGVNQRQFPQRDANNRGTQNPRRNPNDVREAPRTPQR